MTTVRQWLTEFSQQHGEVTHVHFAAQSSWGDYLMEPWAGVPTWVCPLEDFSVSHGRYLDIEFEPGFGAPTVPAIWAWSVTHVFQVCTYDGSTWWSAVPRAPEVDDEPTMQGG